MAFVAVNKPATGIQACAMLIFSKFHAYLKVVWGLV